MSLALTLTVCVSRSCELGVRGSTCTGGREEGAAEAGGREGVLVSSRRDCAGQDGATMEGTKVWGLYLCTCVLYPSVQ